MNQIQKVLRKLVPLSALTAVLAATVAGAGAATSRAWVQAAASSLVEAAQASDIMLQTADASQIRLVFTAAPYSLESYTQGSEELTGLSVPGMQNTQSGDAPALPVKSTLVAIPPGAAYELSLQPYTVAALDGFYRVAPAPQPAPLVEDLTPGTYAPVPFSSIAGLDRWFPESPVRIVEESWIRTQRVLRLEYTPFQYNPARGELRWIPQVQATVLLGAYQAASFQLSPQDADALSGDDFGLADSVINYTQGLDWRTTALLSADKGEAYPGQHSGTPAMRIRVTSTGLYRLAYADLSAAGFDVVHDPLNYHLYNQGRPVAFLIDGDGDSVFEPGESLLFFGEKFDGTYLESVYNGEMINWLSLCPACRLKGIFEKYATENVYWLTAETTPGLLMDVRSAAPQGAPVPSSYLETARAEKQEEWWSFHLTNEDSFFYYPRLQPTVTTTYTYGITLTAVDSTAPAAVIDGSMAWRNSLANHTTTYYFNHPANPGSFAVSVFDGIGRSYFSGTVPASALLDGVNNLKVRLEKNPAGIEYGYFDYYVVHYWRTFTAIDDQLLFDWTATGARQFEVGSMSSAGGYVLDITDPTTPVNLAGVSFTAGQASFEQTLTAGARFGVFGNNAIQVPSEMHYAQPADLDAGAGADYVMIAPQELLTDIQVLADYRESQGMAVKVVDITDLYDQHNYGIRHPIAIRNYLERALVGWTVTPLYALLVGDGHFNLVNSPRYPVAPTPIPPNPMPPNLAFVDPWQGEVDSSALLAMIVGNDRIPDIHIGRIPAGTPERLQAAIAKTIAYEQSPVEDWQRHYLFMNDNVPDSAGMFDESADWLSSLVLTGQGNSTTILRGNDLCSYPGDPLFTSPCTAARDAFTAEINSGTLFATYIGHGAVTSWASEVMYGPTAVQALKNTRLPVILSLTCLDGFWYHPTYQRSLAEFFLIQPDGGAVATVSPTGLGVGTGHDLFAQGIYRAMLQDGEWRLGALVDAGRLSLINMVSSPDLVMTFTLFGDPALRLKSPYSLHASLPAPNGMADPGTSFTFSVNVENTAAVTQSFTGSVTGLSWSYQIQPALLTVPAGGTGVLQVQVSVPSGTERGLTKSFSIKVSSTGDSELYTELLASMQASYLRLFLPSTMRP